MDQFNEIMEQAKAYAAELCEDNLVAERHPGVALIAFARVAACLLTSCADNREHLAQGRAFFLKGFDGDLAEAADAHFGQEAA
jgi:hypothetical protein